MAAKLLPFSAQLAAATLTLSVLAGMPQARAAGSACSDTAAVRLHVQVDGLRSLRGNVTVTLYGSRPEDFLAAGRKMARVRVPVTPGVTKACFEAPEAGIYAIAVYHDEDNDHDFDRTWIGLPTEGYGFSNNAPTVLGPPSFDEVKFEAHPGDNDLRIRMRY